MLVIASGARADGAAFVRTSLMEFTVSSPAATLTGVYSDAARDTNGDGSAESLTVDVGVQVASAVRIITYGELTTSAGLLVAAAQTQSDAAVSGTMTVTLEFPGSKIASAPSDGPYTLSTVRLIENDNGGAPCASGQNVYQTAAYSRGEFAVPDRDGDGAPDATDLCADLADDQRDTDGDGVGDACDNCPAVSNTNQADRDHDRFGDACDLCPDTFDTAQVDTDHDGIGDNCDSDSDGDGVPNATDCAPFDPRFWSAPGEVDFLTLASDNETIAWAPQTAGDGSPVSYDLAKGRLSVLLGSGDFSSSICALAHGTTPSGSDATVPPASEGFYYLARARCGCGPGSYGAGTGGPRNVTGCP